MKPDSPMDPENRMEPDNFQKAWQAQSSETRVTVHSDLLLQEVQRNQRTFVATIFRRDVIEVGVAALLLPYWFYAGIANALPWTWWLGVPAIVWVAGYFLVDRLRHPQKATEPGEPLLKSAKESLIQVEHRIWLLRNIFWWYLLPFTISISAFFIQITWEGSKTWLGFALSSLLLFSIVGAMDWFIYWLNQRAVRVQLEPRRDELQTLLDRLGSDAPAELAVMSGEDGATSSAKIVRWMACFVVCAVALASLGSAVGIYFGRAAEYSKRAPYTGVRWQGDTPEVKVGDEWFTLVSLDDVPAADIVAFTRKTYGDRWRKRFEEDLVEVLSRMGHEPKTTVRLVVSPLGSSKTQTLENVPMTEANRRAIYGAAIARQRGK